MPVRAAKPAECPGDPFDGASVFFFGGEGGEITFKAKKLTRAAGSIIPGIFPVSKALGACRITCAGFCMTRIGSAEVVIVNEVKPVIAGGQVIIIVIVIDVFTGDVIVNPARDGAAQRKEEAFFSLITLG